METGPGKTGSLPWWLGGEEVCGHCLQGYAREEEYRCTGCDGAVCRECVVVVRERRELWCPGCGPVEEEA